MGLMMLKLTANPADRDLLMQIALRAKKAQPRVDTLTLVMDLTAVHLNTCPLRLADLLAADDFNFSHDVFGIHRNIDRNTGELRDCWSPRFHQPAPAALAS